MTLALIEHVRPALVIYQCMGDVTASRPIPAIAEAERQLLRMCDLAFANGVQLLERIRSESPRAYLFRAGVDHLAFQRAAADAQAPPREFAGWGGPVAGYIGSIHQWVDVELLAAVAQALPIWQFVMIGPVLRDVGPLRALPNVHWLGHRPHHELPGYIRYFDVGLIPYVLDTYTASTYPGKLNEYLALGKPVVSTRLPELVAYNHEYGEVVYLAADAPAFARAIIRAVEESSGATRERYLAAARANSWDERVEAMSALIERRLQERSAPASHAPSHGGRG
jgi:glycosyltransferase involved in cell wall biosynthesis